MLKEYQNYNKGIRAENYFASILNVKGIPYKYINSWFDYLINGRARVEVKSCELNNRQGKEYRAGRFSFSVEEVREQIFKENIWVAFVLSYKEKFMLLGFCRSKKLLKKRFIGLHQLERYGIISLEKWIKEVNTKRSEYPDISLKGGKENDK